MQGLVRPLGKGKLVEFPLRFGAELRRLRQDAGMTLQACADAVNYSKGHLCKIERGDKRPTMALARQCDTLFRTGGRLQRMVRPEGIAEADGPAPARRDVIATGVASLLAAALTGPGTDSTAEADGPPTAALFRDQLHQMRRLGQNAAPGVLLPVLRSQAETVTVLAARASGATRTGLLVVAARFAEYTGWMAQEAGDEAAALKWTDDAVELARAGGDDQLADYALVRRALVTFYNGDAAETVGLAQQAQRSVLPPRVRGLAAQREAQGHALAGDERACLRGLERARVLLAAADEAADTPVLGTTNLVDPVSMVTGWCLHDLGRPREAAEVLDRECRRIPPHALRTRTRYGLRSALAHAASGEVERSCEVARELLAYTHIAPSATVRADVRKLDRELSRFRANTAVRELRPALANALSAN
ncbi:helix-turn-helix domain-containing protein [Streptomyces sp. NPDC014734]|uniref:helix-turn-helix domain-containing protein n=1 Tax=Streptomyces sp. NPDC014734 TaxID=3364886 RepID=UPI0036FA18AE